ncbi:hypothetical protein HYH03_006608 [Edaphochlamys debaryana]|uniref:serine C-palmitoyltransferase n=1 Tax=Edaphochlamys debaryana TaxID=47281 RepID=A0A835Y5Z7_9CHLO|nr:hypothetical protein HYH03_006608 [Edaphochlamys debaryana]|eukprot:KAG2495338.1 hypothetical protein HYH03_006608 [Edaphochlamys debaryana]
MARVGSKVFQACLIALSALLLAIVLVGAHAVEAESSTPPPSLFTPAGLVRAFWKFWDIVGPGGKLHPAYFLEHKGHLVIEGILVLLILYLALQHSFKVHPRAEDPLTEKEIDQLCNEWQPEPLAPPVPEKDRMPDPHVITGIDGPHVYLQGRKEKVLNMASSNYLNLAHERSMKDVSISTVDKYGVGSCGPRGFYGTVDVHLALEEELARHFGTPAAIIYSYDVATAASIIPAFANRKDIVIMDEYCSFPIQAGVIVSRARVATFKHNDVADLERVIQRFEQADKAAKKPLCRKLIITEGIFANYGDMAPLDRIWTVKDKYRYRLMVDESHAFGVLGATGRGACEHFGLKPGQVEIISASMSHAMGSVGGFCVGGRDIVEHQRLSGSGYCFSASLPPYLAAAGIHMLKGLRGADAGGKDAKAADKGPAQLQEAMPRLHAKIRAFRADLLRGVPGLKLYGGAVLSPVVHLHVAKPSSDASADVAQLRAVADGMLGAGVLAGVAMYSALEGHRPPPSLLMYVHAGLGERELAQAAAALRKAAKDVFKQ